LAPEALVSVFLAAVAAVIADNTEIVEAAAVGEVVNIVDDSTAVVAADDTEAVDTVGDTEAANTAADDLGAVDALVGTVDSVASAARNPPARRTRSGNATAATVVC